MWAKPFDPRLAFSYHPTWKYITVKGISHGFLPLPTLYFVHRYGLVAANKYKTPNPTIY